MIQKAKVVTWAVRLVLLIAMSLPLWNVRADSWVGGWEYNLSPYHPVEGADGGTPTLKAKKLSTVYGYAFNLLPSGSNGLKYNHTVLNGVQFRFQETDEKGNYTVSMVDGIFNTWVSAPSAATDDIILSVYLYDKNGNPVDNDRPAVFSFSRHIDKPCEKNTGPHDIPARGKIVSLQNPNILHPIDAAAFAVVKFSAKVRDGSDCKR